MKKSVFKRIISFVVASAVAASSAISAMAYTIKIEPNSNTDTSNANRYEAYQIFSGTLSDTTDVTEGDYDLGHSGDDYMVWHELQDIDWGSGLVDGEIEEKDDLKNVADLLDKLAKYNWNNADLTDQFKLIQKQFEADMAKNDLEGASVKSAVRVANVLADEDNASSAEFLQKFAGIVAKYAKCNAVKSKWVEATDEEAAHWVINIEDKGGYYLVVDTTKDVASGDAISPYFLDTAHDITIKVKSNAPQMTKTISKVNGGAENIGPEGDNAVAAIGDVIEFELVGTLPENFATFYENYFYMFSDKLGGGLVIGANPVDKVEYTLDIEGNKWKTIGAGKYTVKSDPDEGKLTVTFKDLTAVLKDALGDDFDSVAWDKVAIKVTYKATLGESAVIGTAGNPNTAHLTYSNNPNTEEDADWDKDEDNDGIPDDIEETLTETPKDTTKVYTFELELSKTDGLDVVIEGAEFSVGRGVDEFAVFKKTAGGIYIVDRWTDDMDAALADGETFKVVTDGDGKLTIKGLDAGTYTFTETKAPEGYALADPFVITLSADKDNKGKYNGKLAATTSLTPGEDENAELDGVNTPSDGIASVSVVDAPIVPLPETGGIGRYIYYVAGGALVLAAAAALLVFRKKSGKKAR